MRRCREMVYDTEKGRYSSLEDWRATKRMCDCAPVYADNSGRDARGPPHLWQIAIDSILPDLMAREPDKMLDMLLKNDTIRSKFANFISENAETRQEVLPLAAAFEKIKDVSVVEENEIVEVLFPECGADGHFHNAPSRTQILKMRFGDLPYKLQASIRRLVRNAANPLPCLKTMDCPVSESISFNAQKCCINCQLNTEVPEMTLDKMPVIPLAVMDMRYLSSDERKFMDTVGNVQASYIEEVKRCAFDNDIEPNSYKEDGTDWVAIPDTLLWDAHEYVIRDAEAELLENFNFDMKEFFDLRELHNALVETNKIITHAPDEVWVRKPRLRLDVFT